MEFHNTACDRESVKRSATLTDYRLGFVLFIEIVTLFYLNRLTLWSGVERETWERLWVGSGAAICLVGALPIVWRGTGLQRLWASLLLPLPGFLLAGILVSH